MGHYRTYFARLPQLQWSCNCCIFLTILILCPLSDKQSVLCLYVYVFFLSCVFCVPNGILIVLSWLNEKSFVKKGTPRSTVSSAIPSFVCQVLWSVVPFFSASDSSYFLRGELSFLCSGVAFRVISFLSFVIAQKIVQNQVKMKSL